MSRHLPIAAGFLSLAAFTASASIGEPWRNLRVVSPNGRYYVVMWKTEAFHGRFALAERKPGSPPVEKLISRSFLPERPDPEIRVREGDLVHSEGVIVQVPRKLLVSSRGLGFVALGSWDGHAEHEVSIVSRLGELLHVLDVDDLLSLEESSDFLGSVDWCRGAWLDDDRAEVVLLAKGGFIRAVSLASGVVREGGPADARRALDSLDPDARTLALEFLAWRRERSLLARFREMYESKTEPLQVKLRAAVALAAMGDRRGEDLVIRAAAPDSPGFDWPDREYALWQTAALVKRSETPHALADRIIEDLRKFGLPALAGESSVPLLVSLFTQYGDVGAAEKLAELGSPRALPALLDAVTSEDEEIARAAARAAIALGSMDVADQLARALLEGAACDGILVEYFTKVRHCDAVPALAAALERGSADRDTVRRAVRFQRER